MMFSYLGHRNMSDVDQFEDSDVDMGLPPNLLHLSAQAPHLRPAAPLKIKSSFTKNLRTTMGKATGYAQVNAAKIAKVAYNRGRKRGSSNFKMPDMELLSEVVADLLRTGAEA